MSNRFYRRFAKLFRQERPAPRSPRARLSLEHLEHRLAPAVFNVISTADNNGPVITAGHHGTAADPFLAPSLRSAIAAANQTPGSNTINLTAPGTYRLTLHGVAGEADNLAGELAILGTGNLSIVNTSRGAVAVDGGGVHRVFDINPAAENTTPFTVTFQGFTIQHGSASPGDGAAGSGGGIRAEGAASVVLNNVLLTNNFATADGGGIVLESPNNDSIGTLTVNASTISNNHAGDAGGGIETDGTGPVTVNPGTLITGNTCVNQGAGIWLDAGGASLTVNGATITYNTAITMLAGGIGNSAGGTVTILNSNVSNNFAGTTGGGFGDGGTTGTLIVRGSSFLNNTAGGNGGAIQEGGPSTTIFSTAFLGNVAEGNGGALFVSGTGSVSVMDSSFGQNTAVSGGAIDDEVALLTVDSANFVGNNATGDAGGNGGSGGAIALLRTTGTATITDALFQENAATSTGNGGGGIGQLTGMLTVSNSRFLDNVTNGVGGALLAGGLGTTVTSSLFVANQAGQGGGAVATNDTSLTLTNDTFRGNTTPGNGGAVFVPVAASIAFLGDSITGNSAGVSGGGAALATTSAFPISFQNTTLVGNTAPTGADLFVTTLAGIFDRGGNLVGSTNIANAPAPGSLLLDTFSRADSPTLGSTWTQLTGTAGVQGGQLLFAGKGPALAVYNSAALTDTEVQADIALPTTGFQFAGLLARYSATKGGNGYLGQIAGSDGHFTAYLFRLVNGKWTPLASAPVSGGTGTLRFEVVGSSLKLFLDGQLVAHAFDSVLTSGTTGVWGGPGATLDNFVAAPLVLTTVTLPFTDSLALPDGSQLSRSWTQQAGSFSGQGGKLLAHDNSPNFATVNQAPAADVVVQASIALGASGVQVAGLVARYSGPGDSNMYLGEVVGVNGKYTAYIFRNVGGTWTMLASRTLTSGTGTLLFTVKGSHLTLSFNGQVVGDVTDTAITAAGLTGIRGGAGALYGNFSVSAA